MCTRALVVVGIGVFAALALVACGSTGTSSPSSSPKNTFTLNEFTVISPRVTMHPGRVTIAADNVGGEVHELLIVRADSIGDLPMKSDGSVDEDKIPRADKIGEIGDIATGTTVRKTFDLTAGNFVAFCNITDPMMGGPGMGSRMGHIHFARGMHTTFRVR